MQIHSMSGAQKCLNRTENWVNNLMKLLMIITWVLGISLWVEVLSDSKRWPPPGHTTVMHFKWVEAGRTAGAATTAATPESIYKLYWTVWSDHLFMLLKRIQWSQILVKCAPALFSSVRFLWLPWLHGDSSKKKKHSAIIISECSGK